MTNAADAVSTITHDVDRALEIRTTSSRHTKFISVEDGVKIRHVLRNLRPFQRQAGRLCEGFPQMYPIPHDKIDKQEMRTFLQRNIVRLGRGQAVETEDDEDDDDDDDV